VIHVSTAVVNNWDSLLLENNDGDPEFRCLEEIDESVDVGLYFATANNKSQ
jgi:hypothetical protein